MDGSGLKIRAWRMIPKDYIKNTRTSSSSEAKYEQIKLITCTALYINTPKYMCFSMDLLYKYNV